MRPKILFIGYIWPEPQSSAAGLRSMSLIRAFSEAGWEVHFASPANRDAWHPLSIEDLGVRTRAIAPNDPSFDSWIAELKPDAVLFERFMMEEQFGWRVAEHCPRAVRILDTVDLHFLRYERQSVLKGKLPDEEDAIREIASIYRCDLTLVISRIELEILTSPHGAYRVPAELLAEFGFCYDVPANAAARGALEDEGREHFMFIGGFRHEPNVDAVKWLKQEIWPKIRARLPHARLDVYGAYPTRELMAFQDAKRGFEMRGPVVDQFEALRIHLVNLAPIRFGAGLKGKISDGWSVGTPCASTAIGAEGMTLEGGVFGGLVAEGADAFADAACRLYEDGELRARTRARGYEILAQRFDHARNSARLLGGIEAIRADLDSHRALNFTGRMLSHHSHRSTKYFSRWIEAKNRAPGPSQSL
jgi:glycosyltransferase involved in cell wall biosynthesis